MSETHRPVVLFDWGDTLVWIPGMIHDPDRHLACVAAIFESEVRPALEQAGGRAGLERYIDCYLKACREQIERSQRTQREHRFADRFALSFQYAGAPTSLPAGTFEAMADRLGEAIAGQARLLPHTAEVVPALARHYRLGLISNYPHAPVVRASLERFALATHFDCVVVSSETLWMKPHPECFRPALEALGAVPARALMVGDSYANDVLGAKALGLHAAWLAPGQSGPAQADIHLQSLAELPEHCRRLFTE